MTKQYKVLVNTGKAETKQTIDIQQGAGDKGQPVRIKAQAGAKYELQELGRKKPVGPDYVKAKRVVKDLHILFEDESQASLIIEDYYEVMPEGYNGVIGQAENGGFYEYIPEDPRVPGLISELAQGGEAVNVALGGAGVSPVGAAVAAAGFPLLGALGLLGAAGAAAYIANRDSGNKGNTGGDLSNASDSGSSSSDNLTKQNNNLVINGKGVPNSTVDVVIKDDSGKTVYEGKATTDANGNYSYTVPGPLPDGKYTPFMNGAEGEPFTIDTSTRIDMTNAGKAGTTDPISGTAEPGAKVKVYDASGNLIGQTTADNSGNWSLKPVNPVPAGEIRAEATDAAGNTASDKDTTSGNSASNKTALTIDPISSDNVLLASEQGASSFTVTGKVTGKYAEGDVVELALNGKKYAAIVAADGSYSVPVSMADLKADPDTKIEATVTGTNGDKASAAQDFTVEAGNTNTKTALSINPVTADNILSAAENTGSLAITGKVTGKYAAGDTVTLTVNGKTFTGAAAADGTYSISVPTSDLSADQDTQIEGTVTGTGGTQASALQDYGVDNSKSASNKTALTLDPIAGDNVLLASEQGANAYNVTGKVTGTFNEGDVVELALNGKTYAATVAADGSFSVPVSMADLKADPNTKIEGTVTGTDGDTATAAQDYNVEAGNTNTQTALSINPVTTDNILSASENTGNVAITGKVTGKYAAGDTVTLSVNGKAFTGAAAADGTYSINVPASDLSEDADTQIDGTVTGTGGTAAQALQDYALDLDGNDDRNALIPPSGELAPGSDSGVPGDRTTNDTTPTIIGQVPAGSSATITLNGKTYPVDVKPDGSYTFTQPDGLPDGTYTPVLNVTQDGETTETPIDPFTIDTVPPSVAISADKIQLLAGQTSTITFTLSEAVSDFSAADITVSGGTLGNLVQSQTDPKVYTAVFTPNTSSTTTSVISVASGRFSDVANNFNTDGAEANNTLNLPTNTQTPGGTIFLAPSSDSGAPGDHRTNDNTPTMTGQVPVGSTAVVSINGRDYPVDVKPDGSYTFTVPTGLPDGTYVPKIIITPAGSSTPNAPQDGTPFTIDTVAPTVLVSSDKATLATGQTATITFTLSEDSSDFTLADVTTTGGTLSNLQGSGKSYTATFTPSANSTTTSTVKVDSFKFSDAAGNFNTDGSDTGVGNTNIVSMPTNTAQADTTAPTIALSADRTSLATGQTTVVTFTLSEASSNFTLADVTATGGTLANLVQSQTDPKIYTAVFTPNAGSTTPSVISVASNKFSDAAGNQNADGADANNTLSLPTNTTPAQTSGQLQPGSDSGTQGDNKTLDNTPTYGGTAPAGSQVEVVINGKTYTTVADSNGQYTVVVPDALPDGTYVPKIIVTPAGSSTPNAPQDGTPFTIDTTPPTVEVTSYKATLAAGQTATITFTLNEASSDFTLADVQVSGGTLSNFQGSGTSYTATFTPNAGSTDPSVVHVASNKFADAAGNANTDGAQSNNTVSMATNTMPADTTAPTIVVARTNAGTTLANGANETITFTLSEASTSFNEGDVSVTGGTLSNFTAIPSSGTAGTGYTQYTATFTPAAGSAGTATVGVAAGTFSDNAGNLNADTFVQGTGYQSDNQVSLAYNTIPADTTAPKIALSRQGSGNLAAGGSDEITFVLSEASTTFSLADVDVVGGTLTNFAPVLSSGSPSTGYTDYTATFTPSSNSAGLARIGVQSGKFTDASNNANLDTYVTGVSGTSVEANNVIDITYNTQLPDTTAPTIVVSRAGAGMVSTSETIYFTLSEASTTFAQSDIDVQGGSLSGFAPVASSGNATNGHTQYTATFTPTANSSGTASVGVKSATFADMAGNNNTDTYVSPAPTGATLETNNQVSLNFNTLVPDTTVPTIAIDRNGTGVVTSTETITFTLSEPSTNFIASDIDVSGGSLSGFAPVLTSGNASTGYTQYTATFTPTAGVVGSASVAVASGKFTDAASNANLDTYQSGVTGTTQELNNIVEFSVNTDTTAPTVAIARASGATTQTFTGAETINITLSEASRDFAATDLVATGGSLSGFAPVLASGSAATGYTQYTVTFTPTANASGNATISVANTTFSDAGGNTNRDTGTNPAPTGATYEANNLISAPFNTDTTAPTVIVTRTSGATSTVTGAESITFTFSEAINPASFDANDIDAVGGAMGNLQPDPSSGSAATGYTRYTATYTPTSGTSGSGSVGVLASKFTDMAGNANTDSYALTGAENTNNQVAFQVNTSAPDTTAPTIAITRAGAGTVTGTEVIYFTLSEASTTFTSGDIDVSGGSLSGFAQSATNPLLYSATFSPTPNATGNATIGVAAGKFQDAANNQNLDTYSGAPTAVTGQVVEGNNQLSLAYNTDTTAPTIVVGRQGSGTVTGPITVTFTLSEASTDFSLADMDAVGGTLSNLQGSGTSYTATFTPTANAVGTASVGVASSKFTDAAGNFNLDTYLTGISGTTSEGAGTPGANIVVFQCATDATPPTPPTIAITSDKTTLTSGQTATITFTLSEASSNFTLADIDTTGGSLGTLTQSSTDPKVYTAVFTPTAGGTGNATIGVLSGKFSDAALNNNEDTYESAATAPAVYESNNQVSLAYNTRGNSVATIDIVSASTDSGASASDFITNDQTLTYAGTITGWVPGLGDRVMLQFYDSNGQQMGSNAFVAPAANGAWTWDDTANTRAAGTYSLKATIVSASGTTAINSTAHTSVSGNLTQGGYDQQTVVIDTVGGTTAEINLAISIITDADNNTYVNKAELGTATTFTSRVTFDPALAKPGMVITISDGTTTTPITLTPADVASGFVLASFTKPAEGATQTVTAKLTDLAGNLGTQTVSDSATLDTTAITVAVSRALINGVATNATLGVGGSEVITFTLSEASSNFAWNDTTQSGDITVTGGTLGALTQSSTNPLVYTATFTPAANTTGTAKIGVLAGKFSDAALNNNLDTYTNPATAPEVNETNNQVSVLYDTLPPAQVVSFSSMTKDSGVAGSNADWSTSNASAGRLVSGFLSAPLAAGEIVNVYANNNLIGAATVAPNGTTWEITDLNGYTANWTYTANVVDSNNNLGVIATQAVTYNYAALGAPVITSVGTDATFATIVANNGTTSDNTLVVKGTGTPGAYITLFDNTATTVVKSNVLVDSTGNWVADLTGAPLPNGVQNFYAMQNSTQGSASPLSNQYAVTINGTAANLVVNGSFEADVLQAGTWDDLYTISGWVIQSGNVDLMTDSTQWGPTTPWGNQYIDLAGDTPGTIYQDINNLVVGQTYTWSYSFHQFQSQDQIQFNLSGATTYTESFPTAVSPWETKTGSFVAGSTTVRMEFINIDTNTSPSSGVYFDNVTLTTGYTAPNGTLVAGADVWTNPNAVNYNAGILNTMASNDIITVGNTSLQATLTAGGIINGGAGIDNLKLAAGTTLNLESLTGNQTVRPIEQVEMITLQGGTSVLTMSANDVLSLGGSNAPTMEPYTFTSTTQVATSGGVQATGSTTSTGKVQFVVNGQLNDVLNLSVLANDGVVSTNGASAGLLGNTDLAGSWAYKGTFSIAAGVAVDGVAHTYKVYDHSTTGAQVLVDVDVTVNTITPITISAISTDAGNSGTDFVTNDQTLTYSGGLPAAFNSATERVLVEILNSSNVVVSTGFATPNGTTWSWNNETVSEAAGNYTIRATIVGQGNTTPVAAYGAGVSTTHQMTIDLTPPQVAISRTDGLTTTVGSAGTQVTFTLSEASSDFTWSGTAGDIEVSGGTLSALVQSSTNPLVYTATFTPDANAAGTGYVRIASSKFMDAAGNNNVDTYVTGANYQANNLQEIPYDTLPPTQTVAFSSMTKDSGVTADAVINKNWTTNDTSAGRLLSGTLSAPLDAGDVVKVYANGTLIGTATVAPGGKTWEITDTSGYSAGWTYTAQVVDSQNATGTMATQVVNADLTEAAPVITGVFDTASSSTTIANNGTTTKALSSVKGTGVAGNTIYLYDNNYTTLVGSAVVDGSGNWSVTSLTGTFNGSNTFAARQVDAQGNQSGLSNQWTVNAPTANTFNGSFDAGNTGFTTEVPLYTSSGSTNIQLINLIAQGNRQSVVDDPGNVTRSGGANPTPGVLSGLTAAQAWTNGTWQQNIYKAADVNQQEYQAVRTFTDLASGKMLAGSVEAVVGSSATNTVDLWVANVDVVQGKSYTFSFDYWNSYAQTNAANAYGANFMDVKIDGMTATSTKPSSAGQIFVTYVATRTGSVKLSLESWNTTNGGDYMLDNMAFGEAAPANTLVTAGPTANPDNLTYTAGVLDALDSNDTITTTSTGLQATLAAGGMVDGGAGVDTLKLAPGTTLNLDALNGNQTVRPIQEVEIFQMQGTSSLTLSANDVLSLGGSNASTMAGYTFSTTTGGTASASSTGKVQMVITGTASDTLVLDPLMKDGVTTNGVEGNTGLAGQWDDMGTTVIGGVTYKVYNHSTTQAQVLTTITPTLHSNDIAFSSMTKDSGVTADASINSNWITNDASAGRLISGTVATPLAAGDVVNVYANGTLIGPATLNSARTAWEITDTAGYNASWVYSANIVSASGTSTTAYQPVNADLTEAAPVITGVFDTASTTTIANNGTTTDALSSVKGTGVAGNTIYLYDNNYTTLVGTAVVDASGSWSVTLLTGTVSGVNTFAAKQVDAQGNQSVMSNLWTVGTNLFGSGDFGAQGQLPEGFTTDLKYSGDGVTPIAGDTNQYNVLPTNSPLFTYGLAGGSNGTPRDVTTGPYTAPASYGGGVGTWSKSFNGGTTVPTYGNPNGAFSGTHFVGQVSTAPAGGTSADLFHILETSISVVAGQTYTLDFDYITGMTTENMSVTIDGAKILFAGKPYFESGHFTATYTAPTTKNITVLWGGKNPTGGGNGDFALDNLSFVPSSPNASTAFTNSPTANPDSLSYTAGALDALGSNDTITATSTGLQATLAAGGMVDGGAGMDTLKLAPGTILNLDALNGNQTVRPIQEVEIFQMQGASSLTLSANDVLSLGGSNASTMAGYTFTSTTGGTASASSTGKVQMVITGTASDTLALVPLMKDGVTTNSIQGNTGLAGQWDDMGTTVIGGVTYKVYNHSTTQAQVLTTITPTVHSNDIAFSSMTKDSGLAGYTANWVTADGSAGRLISGTVATPLAAGDVVNVYANGTLIGPATVNTAGTAWEITDTAGYNASWVYSANIVSASGTSTTATQPVTADFVATAPTITSVHDLANVAVGATGTNAANANPTSNALSSVSGTAPVSAMGSVIYLYDNSTTNLVGSAVVDSSGNWTVTGLSVSTATNSFAAVMLDVNGKQSPLSNLWTVNTSASGIVNGDFSNDLAGFTSDVGLVDQTNPAAYERASYIFGGNRYSVVDLYNARMGDVPTNATIPGGSNWSTGTYPASGTLTQSVTQNWTGGTWSQKTYNAPDTNYGFTTAWGTFFNLARDGVRPGTVSGAPDGRILMGSADGIFAADTGLPSSAANPGRLWASQSSVVKGQTYEFSFDYWNSESKDRVTPGFMDVVIDGQVAMSTTNNSAGEVTVKYVANKTGLIDLSLNTWSTYNAADYALDNIAFRQVAPADGSLLPGGTPPATPNPDALDYTGGPLDALEGNDVMTLTATDVSGMFSGGGYINGGAGVDTLKLAAGTTLNLDALTRNQTVQPIQQVEVFQLQGASNLTLTANDVLSLGGANATTMSGYTFTTTSGGTGSASSTSKVQFVVNGTSTDTVTLATLTSDGVTTNGTLGNTGLAGTWADMGTTVIGSVTYKVYNHSTTQAQVLVAGATASTPANTQSIAITHANNSNVSGTYTEEFGISGSTAVNTVTNTVDTAAWTITAKDLMTGKAPVSELKLTTGSAGGSYASYTDPAMGTDAKLVLGNAASTNANEPRVNTFTSKAGEFTAIAFNYLELNYAYANNTNGGALVKFYNADGVVIHSTLLTATSLSTLGLFNYSLPAGMTASSFSIQTNTNDQWFMDGLKMIPAASTDLPHNSATLDSSPLLSGTYVSELNAGDVIKVYDGSTLVGTAIVDAASKTWTLQLPTGQSVGSHTYVAKVVSSANADVATSNNFTLNVLSGALPPVVMDLNLDGVLDYSQVQMDLNGDGALDTTAWVGSQDGLLVHDAHDDGSVRSTSQFAFARHAGETDLQGLAAQFDSNQDGVFNAQDAQFGEMAVWQDADQDGVADAGEVKHLIDLGITEIALVSDGVVRTPAEGVTEAGQSSAQLANGSSMLVSDAAFAYQLNASQVTLDLTVEPTPDDEVTAFKLNVADVMAAPADANGQHVVQVKGDGNDTLNLSNLLGAEAPGQWLAAGTVQQGGVTFNTYNYSADTSLQVMVEQHLQNVTLS